MPQPPYSEPHIMYRTPQFEAFVAPARHRPRIWRLLLGILTAIIVYIIIAGALATGAAYFKNPGDPFSVLYNLESPGTPFEMGILLATFLGMVLGAFAAALWHHRPPATLFGPPRRVWRHFLLITILVSVLTLLGGLVMSFLTPHGVVSHVPLTTWLGWLPWVLPLLLIQITAEELIFRGYLQQQLAARFKSPLIWMLLPSVLFGLVHYSSHMEPVTGLFIVLATGTFGLVAADLTRITGSLGAAMGFHFANNFFALLVVAVEGELSGLALYHTDFRLSDTSIILPLLIADIVMIIFIWAVARRILR